MRRISALAAFALMVILPLQSAIACGGPPVCTVKDPTGTPLNVRAAPKGVILANLKNGQKVEVIDHQKVKGQRWARIGHFTEGDMQSELDSGWVFANYLKCDSDVRGLPDDFPSDGNVTEISCVVRDPTGTPLNVRGGPGGEIYATVRNGTVLRAMVTKMHKGKPWVLVAKWAEDNAIGWVFDPYLQCEEDEGH